MSRTVSTARHISIGSIVVGCIALVAANLNGLAIVSAVAKLAASTGFIGLALACGALDSRYGRLVLAGLVFSWFGDAFLLGRDPTLFLLGLAAFLLAHVAYAVGFGEHGVARGWVWRAAVPVIGASAWALWWLTPYVPNEMSVPVWIYVIVISVMVTLAAGTRGAGGSICIPLGAAMFYLSDLSVAAGQFVKPDFPNYVWGLPLYYAGQTLLALSVRSRRTLTTDTPPVQSQAQAQAPR